MGDPKDVKDEGGGIEHQQTCEPSSRKSIGEKLSHRKKARTDAYNSERYLALFHTLFTN
ncbi:hypothetical protein YC2023_015425 [Brassica napus]